MRARNRPGMTLGEIITAVVIVSAIAAVVTPTVSGYLARNRANAVAAILDSLNSSLNNNNLARGRLGFVNRLTTTAIAAAYPNTLNVLTRALKTSDVRCVGPATNKFTTTDSLNWLKGLSVTPGGTDSSLYSDLRITPGVGIATPIGVIRDSVLKGSGTTAGFAELHIDSVWTIDAENLDLAIDGTADSTTGRIRYSAATGSPKDLHFVKFLLPGYGC